MTRRVVLYDGEDSMVRRTLARICNECGMEITSATDSQSATSVAVAVAIVVVELGADDDVAQVEAWHSRCPEAVVMGYFQRPDPQRWRAAERAGCDMVTTRGGVGPQLRKWVESGAVRRQRLALLDSADIAGRLGFIQRLEPTPIGALAIFRVDGALYGLEDRCPHAGRSLSDGALEGGVVTCPGHGSQFSVCSGERLRGPADEGVRSHRLVEEGGRVYLEWSTAGS